MKTFITTILLTFFAFQLISQNQIQVTEDGIILPIVDHTMISSPSPGLVVYDGGTESFWYYTNSEWKEISDDSDANSVDEIQEFIVSETNDTLFLSESNFVIIPGLSAANDQSGNGGTDNGTPGPDITDSDGNVYPTVIIGAQTWMAENLKTTKYDDGTAIPYKLSNADWANANYNDLPAFCWYENDSTLYAQSNGALYNAYAIFGENNGNKSVCPANYHVPTIEDINELMNYLAANSLTGGDLKEEGTVHWDSPNFGATDSTGFAGRGAGVRISTSGVFNQLKTNGTFHTSTGYNDDVNFSTQLYFNNENFTVGNGTSQRGVGRSVRCIKD